MATPLPPRDPNNGGGGVEVSGYGASLKAYGRNAIIFAGFLTMAGALLVDGWLTRQDRIAQTKLLTEVFETQKAFIQGYVNAAGKDHDRLKESVVELKAFCLAERFAEKLHPK